jgi:folylpolyglutamate synthase/dihydropteroate synthase
MEAEIPCLLDAGNGPERATILTNVHLKAPTSTSNKKGILAMLATKDISKLLANVPKGAWVALSSDEERVVAYASELAEVIKKAEESGESNPVVIRVPEDGSTLIL